MTTALLLAALVLTIVSVGSLFHAAARLGSVPMPSAPAVRRALLAEVARYPHPRVVDLGSGWGGLGLHLARALPDREVVGVEASPLPLLVSRLRSRRVANLSFEHRDLRTTAPRSRTIYVCYLSPRSMRDVAAFLEREAAQEVVVISAHFGLRGRRPVRTARARDLHHTEVLVYEV